MCGFIYNVNDFPLLEPILDIAGYDEDEIRDIIRNKYLHPTDTIINLVPSRTGPRLMGGTWWLAINTEGEPDPKYASFNSKVSKLANSPLHTRRPRSVRSVVLASGFCEWQPTFKGGYKYTELQALGTIEKLPQVIKKQQYLIEQEGSPLMLLGGVSKLRVTNSGQPKVNTSVITLPPHESFLDIHYKSFPLILNIEELSDWLNPSIPLSEFSYLTELKDFRMTFTAKAVDNTCKPLGDEVLRFGDQ